MCPIKIIITIILLLSSWNDIKIEGQAIRSDVQEFNHSGPIVIKSGDIEVSFIDNSAYGQWHKSRYNGISELKHARQDSSIFVPFYAGFNLEHVFGGDSLSPLFEPRVNKMELKKISDNEVELHQEKLPLSQVESWTKFKLSGPHFVDITFRYIIHSDTFFKHNYAGIFWASYINAPADKGINFIGRKSGDKKHDWIKAYSPKHGAVSTHMHENDHYKMYVADNFNVTLASHYSGYRFKDPFYFGIFHNMAMAYMFDVPDDQILRFAQSPTGGGEYNPAWDFYIVNPDFEVGKAYEFSVRMLYKPFESPDDIRKEFKKWVKEKN